MSLPRGWVATTLGDVGQLYCGQSVSAAEVNREGKGISYVTGPEQWDGATLHLDKWTETPKRVVPAGCTFITVKGAGVGKTFPGGECAIGRDVYAYKPEAGVDSEFIRLAISNQIASIIHAARGDIPGLSKEHITDNAQALPPAAEQRRIVAKLDALTARIARARAGLDRVPVLARRFREEALNRCFEFGSYPVIPLGSELQKIEAGKNLRCEERPPRNGENGVVKVSAVTWGRFDETQSKTLPSDFSPPEKSRIKTGDLLISRANTLELVGAIVIVEEQPRDLFLSDKILRLVVAEENKKWILWFLRSPDGRRQIETMATGNQLSMRNISQDALRKIMLPFPEPRIRSERIRLLERAFARADRLEAEAARARKLLDRLETAILAKAFRGELVPQNENDEPASVLLERIRAERASAPNAHPRRSEGGRSEPEHLPKDSLFQRNSMPVASRETYCRWIANALTALGPSRPQAVYDWIRRNETVPSADLSGLTSDGENLFEKEVRFARWKMSRDGRVSSPARGIWALK